MSAPVFLGAQPAGAVTGYSPVQAVPVPVGSDARSSNVTSIACPAAGSCTALGTTGTGTPFVVDQTTGRWGAASALSVPAGSLNVQLALACSSPGNCIAAGSTGTPSGSTVPLLAEESSGTWGQASTLALPADALTGAAEQAALFKPWCDEAGNCEVVGLYEASGPGATWELMTATQTGGSWGAATTFGDASALVGIIKNVITGHVAFTCTSIGNCLVIVDGESWTEAGGAWGPPVALNASGLSSASTFQVADVACPTTTTCLAVGEVFTIGCNGMCRPWWEAATTTETAGTWSPVAEDGAGPLGSFSAISCVAEQCVAVGDAGSYNDFDPYDFPQAITWSNGQWSAPTTETVPLPSGATTQAAWFNSVGCTSSTQCVAVGWRGDFDAGGGPRSLGPFSTTLTPVSTATTPAAPTGLAVTPEIGGAEVSWTPPVNDGGAPITTYTVTAQPGGSTCVTATTSCQLVDLTNGARYRFRVVADNGTATSVAATGSAVVGAIPAAPTGLRVATVRHVPVIAWAAPSTPVGEPVIKYSIVVSAGASHVTYDTKSARIALGGTHRGGSYSISVSAYDASGWSAPTNLLLVVT